MRKHHFLSNQHNKIDNVLTKHSFVADHDAVIILFHAKDIVDRPQYLLTRDWSNMNRENLISEMSSNPNLPLIFKMTNPNKIWNIIFEEMNKIINKLASPKVVKCSKDWEPYLNDEIKTQMDEAHLELNKAISSGALEQWPMWR